MLVEICSRLGWPVITACACPCTTQAVRTGPASSVAAAINLHQLRHNHVVPKRLHGGQVRFYGNRGEREPGREAVARSFMSEHRPGIPTANRPAGQVSCPRRLPSTSTRRPAFRLFLCSRSWPWAPQRQISSHSRRCNSVAKSRPENCRHGQCETRRRTVLNATPVGGRSGPLLLPLLRGHR